MADEMFKHDGTAEIGWQERAGQNPGEGEPGGAGPRDVVAGVEMKIK
jgi:hypothetical protein